MQKAHDASKNNWWRNFPNIDTPITQDQLNRNEQTVDTIDDRVVAFDTTKANQTDLLTCVSNVTFDSTTGTFTFTKKNGTTIVIDTDIEKVITNFDYDDDPTSPHYQSLVLTLDDGTVKYVDMSALVTEYEFADTSTIHYSIDGDGVISFSIPDGAITGAKLQPNYLADCLAAKSGAETAETHAETAESNALAHQYNAEAWAKGTKDNVPVTPTDAQYHDNAYYWAQQARAIVGDKVDSFNGRTGTVVAEDGDYPSDYIVPETGAIPGQVPVVRNVGTGQDVKLRYVNEDLDIGLKPHIIVISETGSTVTLTKGTKVIYADETSTGHFEADVPEFGTWVIDSVLSGDDAQISLVVDTVKVYTVDDSHFHADITITFPYGIGATCSLSAAGQTTKYATASPYTFTVHEAGSYTLTVTYDGNDYTETISVTATGQTFTKMLPTTSNAPVDDIEMWLFFGGIDNSESTYTSLADILADSTALSTLMSTNNAVDYLVRCTTWATDVCGSSDAMSYIGLNNYAANTLLADATWRTAICNSTYFESVLNVKVPTMTSNTTPSGECFGTNVNSNAYYNAFDGSTTTSIVCTPLPCAIGYKFTSDICLKRFMMFNRNEGAKRKPKTFKVQASTDGTNFTDISPTYSNSDYSANAKIADYVISDMNEYQYFRVYISENLDTSTPNEVNVGYIQFYGREDV